MPYFPNYLEQQKQNEMRKIAEAQNRLAYLDQQQQIQQGNQINGWGNFNNQGTQQSIAQSQGIIGKVVNDFSEITANDVPMNGSAAFFPKADGSELQVRSWTANGTIQTVVYKPILDQNQADSTNIPQNDFSSLNEDVRALREEILARLDNIEKSVAKPIGRTKKAEVNADE